MCFAIFVFMKLLHHTILLLAGIAFFSCKEEINPVTTNVANVEVLPEDAQRESIIAFAKKYMGTKYCYAGGTPQKGFDCSGFVNFVYKHFDVALPRSSSGFTKLGKSLKPEDFKVGDVLVFYGYKDSKSVGHVGIVCEANGMKSKFIHASSGKEMAVTISELGSDQYTRRFYKCIDPLKL